MRIHHTLGLAACVLGCSAGIRAPVTPTAQPIPVSELPIHKIRFYQSGIAQFERAGRVRGGSTTIALPRSQVEDALKTLVVYRGEKPIPAVSIDLDGILAKGAALALAKLPLAPDGLPGYLEILRSLEGEIIEVSADGRILQGRLMHASEVTGDPAALAPAKREEDVPTAASGDPTTKTEKDHAAIPKPKIELTMLTDNRAVERISCEQIAWFRAVDPTISARIERAVAETSAHESHRFRGIRLLTGPGTDFRVSYVMESPIWQASYRLRVLPVDGQASLKGSAVIHNESDEAWSSVQIELSNSEADSLVSSLAEPRYWRRPAAQSEIAQSHTTAPLTSEGNPPTVTEDPPDKRDPSRSPEFRGMPRRQPLAIADGRSEFLYRATTSPTLAAHSSALVPFLDMQVKAERGVWLEANARVGRSIIHLKNTSSAAIPAGTMAVFEGERYSGEVEIEQLEPGHSGYLDVGTALGLASKELPSPELVSTYRRATWKDDGSVLTFEKENHSERMVELENSSNEDRVAFLPLTSIDANAEEPRVQGAEVVEVNDAKSKTIARIVVPAHKKVSRTFILDQKTTEEASLDLESPEIAEDALKSESLPAPTRAVLREAAQVIKARTSLQKQKGDIEQEISRIEELVTRLGDAQTQAPLAARLVQLEGQRSQLQAKDNKIDQSLAKNQELLRRTLSKLPSK